MHITADRIIVTKNTVHICFNIRMTTLLWDQRHYSLLYTTVAAGPTFQSINHFKAVSVTYLWFFITFYYCVKPHKEYNTQITISN